MDPQRIDFTPLDPAADPAHFECLVEAIARLAAPELALRASRVGPMFLLAQWARPLLAAAASLAALSAGTLAIADRPAAAPQVVVAPGLPEALRLPSPVSDWLTEDRSPSVSDLLVALADGGVP